MKFVEMTSALADEQQLHFYEPLAHNLTVAVRGVWSDPSISDAEKVERMKWVNEILHRATSKVWVLRLKTHEWTEEDFGSLVQGYIDQHPGIEKEVVAAVSRSYLTVTGEGDRTLTGDGSATTRSGDASMNVKVFNHRGQLVAVNVPKVVKTDEEWVEQLTPEQYQIARGKGTERPFCGTLLDNKRHGVYACVCCRLPLFESGGKFNSGTGWPSFFRPIAAENVVTQDDRSHGMVRTEILCARCDGHLGHVFEDGPPPTGIRYCVNSESLTFTDQADLANLADPAADPTR